MQFGEIFFSRSRPTRLTVRNIDVSKVVERSLEQIVESCRDRNISTPSRCAIDLEGNSPKFHRVKPRSPQIPHTEQLIMAAQPNYTDDRFWKKLSRFARKAGKQVVGKALLLYYAAQSPTTPKWAKTTIYGALAYFILPTDLIPDFIPVAGYGDDLTTLAAALGVVAIAITPEIKDQARQKLDDWFGDKAALPSEEPIPPDETKA